LSFTADFKEGFTDFGKNIGKIVNFLLLTSVYFTAVALTFATAKISKKRFIQERNSGGSYWQRISKVKKDTESNYRQF